MSETTSILDLPTDPVTGGSINNITISSSDIPQNTTNSNANNVLDQNVINQLVNGLQHAALNGSTALPSRDIPMNTSSIMSDPQIMPNYIPPKSGSNEDYIKSYEDNNSIINNYNKQKERRDTLDDAYGEIQFPLLLALLYFLFQLPFFKNLLYRSFPFLFTGDGNYGLQGLLFISILYGTVFYLFTKILGYFSAF